MVVYVASSGYDLNCSWSVKKASRASGGDNLMRWNEAMTDKNADPNECT